MVVANLSLFLATNNSLKYENLINCYVKKVKFPNSKKMVFLHHALIISSKTNSISKNIYSLQKLGK